MSKVVPENAVERTHAVSPSDFLTLFVSATSVRDRHLINAKTDPSSAYAQSLLATT
jgi:hypothetical protein